jgi:hypothetical protein
MKKLALVFVVALGFTSCSHDVESFREYNITGVTSIKIMKIEGHDYLIYDGFKQGGICHSESCPCKSK